MSGGAVSPLQGTSSVSIFSIYRQRAPVRSATILPFESNGSAIESNANGPCDRVLPHSCGYRLLLISGSTVTCREIHEQVTAYVDNRVDEQEYRAKLEQHISYCADCRKAYEMELMTKLVVRDRSARAEAPGGLRKAIEGGIDSIADERRSSQASATQASAERSFLDRLSPALLSPAGFVVAMVLIVAGVYLLGHDSSEDKILAVGSGEVVVDTARPAIAGPENFINKASANFEAIRQQKLAVGYPTDNQQELTEYFKQQGIGYDAVIQPVRATLAGGVVSQHGSRKFAHWVYTRGDSVLIYFFEVPRNSLQEGEVVYLTPDALERLDKGEKIWQEFGAGQQMVVYKIADLICAIVSNVPKEDLQQIVPGL